MRLVSMHAVSLGPSRPHPFAEGAAPQGNLFSDIWITSLKQRLGVYPLPWYAHAAASDTILHEKSAPRLPYRKNGRAGAVPCPSVPAAAYMLIGKAKTKPQILQGAY